VLRRFENGGKRLVDDRLVYKPLKCSRFDLFSIVARIQGTGNFPSISGKDFAAKMEIRRPDGNQ
jgi:hypothetical protein